jgi:FkbM family methyltransferase
MFVDVGAHFGESVLKALQPCYGFDSLIAFEPSSLGARRIKRIWDRRVQVRRIALADSEKTEVLYGAGHLGASLFSDKETLLMRDDKELVRVQKASTELAPFLQDGYEVFLKINCEGGEIAILDDLNTSGLLTRFRSVYVDWDAKKVPSLRLAMLDIQSRIESYDNIFHAHDFADTGWLGVERWLDKVILGSATPSNRLPEHNFLRQPWRFIALMKKRAPRVFRLLVRVRNRIRS